MSSNKDTNFDRPNASPVLQVINQSSVRYLHALLGCYINLGDHVSASRIRKVIAHVNSVYEGHCSGD